MTVGTIPAPGYHRRLMEVPMIAQRLFSSLFVIIALIPSGCAMETDDDLVADESVSVPLDTMSIGDPTDLPPGSRNGFFPACFWNLHVIPGYRKYAPQRLWNSPMGSNYGTLPPNAEMDMVPAACRAEALKSRARCALPKGNFAIVPTTGPRYCG